MGASPPAVRLVHSDLLKTLRRASAYYPHDVVDAAFEVRQMIRIVADDPDLPPEARYRARSLESLAASEPRLVWDRLKELRQAVIPHLPMEAPIVDYARCISVPVFWRYHLRLVRRKIFRTSRDYLHYLEALVDPAAAVRRDLDGRILVPASHSWLVPADRIAGLGGAKTKIRLQIDHDPPYIVMVFPVARMRAAGVEIREPRGVDAIPGRFVQWSSGDVPDERIDRDIPRAALGGLEWRP